MENIIGEFILPLLVYAVAFPGTFVRWLFTGMKKDLPDFWQTERKKRDFLIGAMLIAGATYLIIVL